MRLTAEIAKHFREVHFGGNWTSVNLKDSLAGVTWEQATTKIDSFNTIAALVFHMNYFVVAAVKVLEGGPLDAHDRFSFDVPVIGCQADWDKLLKKTWADAEKFAALIEKLSESKLWEDFADAKYGSYYRNLHGVVEHCHYHLGQVVVMKKMILHDK